MSPTGTSSRRWACETRAKYDFFKKIFCSVFPDEGKCGNSNQGPPIRRGNRVLLYQTFLPRYLGQLGNFARRPRSFPAGSATAAACAAVGRCRCRRCAARAPAGGAIRARCRRWRQGGRVRRRRMRTSTRRRFHRSLACPESTVSSSHIEAFSRSARPNAAARHVTSAAPSPSSNSGGARNAIAGSRAARSAVAAAMRPHGAGAPQARTSSPPRGARVSQRSARASARRRCH